MNENEYLKLLFDERFARDKERIDKIDELLRKLSDCQIQLTEIEKNNQDKLADHEKRLDEIEHRPRDWVDKAVSGMIAAAVAFLMGVILK